MYSFVLVLGRRGVYMSYPSFTIQIMFDDTFLYRDKICEICCRSIPKSNLKSKL